MADEKVYFDDDMYLVTSKRLLIRKNAETLPIARLSAPRVERKEPTDNRDFVDRVTGFFKGGDFLDSYIGTLELIVDVDGKPRGLEFDCFWHELGRNPNSQHLREDSSQKQERKAYLHKLAEAIGAAIVGA